VNRNNTHMTKTSQSPWRLSDVNKDYSMCGSYPRALVVPRLINDKEVLQCATFRSEGRIPSLTWGNGSHAGSIWRSSQPKVGLQGNQNSYDEKFLNLMAESASNIYGGGRQVTGERANRSNTRRGLCGPSNTRRGHHMNLRTC